MHEFELELAVGDAVQIGDCIVTVVDLDGAEVGFRIDSPDPHEMEEFALRADSYERPPGK